MQSPWLSLRDANDTDIPLLSTALLIAKDEYPELDGDHYESRLQKFTDDLREPLGNADSTSAQLRCINRYLFDELGFGGDEKD